MEPMNLPEGALLVAVRSAIAKVAGTDDLTVLRVVGGNTIGRNRFSRLEDDAPIFPSEPESLEEILSFPDALELFNELVTRYALRSGANEFLCMTAARKAGLATPEFHLSENGGLFVMKRFDIGAGGASCGFEDFCSLQALGTDGKYDGSYERVAKSIADFASPEYRTEARERFFGALVLSVAVRNGNAHLKNFGVLYDDAKGPVRLAPIYDIVTTTAYLKSDVPALTIEGRKIWWPRKTLEKFAVAHLAIPPAKAREIIDRVLDAVDGVRDEVRRYMADHPGFVPVGEGMLAAWRAGVDGLSAHRPVNYLQ